MLSDETAPGPPDRDGPSGPADPLLEVRSLEVKYGQRTAVRDASLCVGAGEIVTLLGANGAGKSSLLKGIMRLAEASGRVDFDGVSLLGQPSRALIKMGIAFVPEGRQVFPTLTVEENLFIGAASIPARRRREAVGIIIDEFPLLGLRRRQQAGTLSGGEQALLALARALVTNPRLCILDEPSLGLAPQLVEESFQQLRQLALAGMAVLVAEQLAAAALNVADRGYVLEQGQVRIEGDAYSLLVNPEVQQRYLGVVSK